MVILEIKQCGSFVAQTTFSIGNTPYMVVVNGFNNDGKFDLAVTDLIDASVSILLGFDNETFRTQTKFSVGNSPMGVTTGDFNADGQMDFAVVNNFDNTISILLNDCS
jgi:hypothetical protein